MERRRSRRLALLNHRGGRLTGGTGRGARVCVFGVSESYARNLDGHCTQTIHKISECWR